MKTAKELQKIFINGRYGKGTDFYHYTKKLIYDGYTTFDLLIQTYKPNKKQLEVLKTNPSKEACSKVGLDFDELQRFINNKSKEISRKIDSRFEKYRIELNRQLKNN